MEEEKKDKGFRIRDRRFSAEESEAPSEPLKDEPKKQEPRPEDQGKSGPEDEPTSGGATAGSAPYPEINFSNFIFSLSSSVLLHFGDIPDPITGKAERDLSAAKQTIDILGMLQEKTKGNLDENERKLIDGILFELRTRYVKEKGKG